MADTLLEVGRIAKAHGLVGEVVVELISNRPERLHSGEVFVARRNGHDERELIVESTRPHQGRHLVRFEGIGRREAAEALRGLVLFGEPIADDDALFVHDLIGSVVISADGTARGTVTAVLSNPASDLLVIDEGVLCPLTFVVAHEPGRVTVDAPEGIFP
jgi:16S rRNA processing protein RimM